MIEQLQNKPRLALSGGELGKQIDELLVQNGINVYYPTSRSLAPTLVMPDQSVLGATIKRPGGSLKGLINSGSLFLSITNEDSARESQLTDQLIPCRLTDRPNSNLVLAPKKSVDFIPPNIDTDKNEKAKALWKLLAGTFIPTSYVNTLISELTSLGLGSQYIVIEEEDIYKPQKNMISIVPMDGKVEGLGPEFPPEWIKAVFDVGVTFNTLTENGYDPNRCMTFMESSLMLYLNPKKLAILNTNELSACCSFLDALNINPKEDISLEINSKRIGLSKTDYYFNRPSNTSTPWR
jgi:hypothetical protein